MFQYLRPTRLEEVGELLAAHQGSAALLAGGTDLLVALRSGKGFPEVLIDLKRVADLGADISAGDSSIRIGALTVLADVERSSLVRDRFPALARAAGVVGSIQIRNRATLAGNICNASPAADTAPPLLAYGAAIQLFGLQGSRTLPISEFFLGYRSTALEPGEIVVSIEVPYPPPGCGSSFQRITRRRGVDLATVSAACLLQPHQETLFGMGAVGPTPLRVRDDTGILSDPAGDPQQGREAIARLAGRASPISDLRSGKEYRAAMLQVVLLRAYEESLRMCLN